jgi:hypothetical protein
MLAPVESTEADPAVDGGSSGAEEELSPLEEEPHADER